MPWLSVSPPKRWGRWSSPRRCVRTGSGIPTVSGIPGRRPKEPATGSEITRDPFEAKHLPLQNLKLKEDKYFTFDIQSTRDTKDEDDTTKTVKKVFHFKYDIASKKLEELEKAEKAKYPRWAVVSPDGTMGVYVKNHDLFWMDSTSLRKAAKDPKDSTLVEHRLTTDGTKDFSWNGNSYNGDTEADSTARRTVPVVWSPDSKRFATLRWDMSKVKDFWVINSTSKPRPTLETYKYQMPGEPGPTGTLYVAEMPSGTFRAVKTHAPLPPRPRTPTSNTRPASGWAMKKGST